MAARWRHLQELGTLPLIASLVCLLFPTEAVPVALPQGEGDEAGRGANDNPPPEDPNVAGASGGSKASITLSTPTIIVIAVVVAIVVLLGLGSALLFYIAKKRQWEVRKNIRRSAKRVTTAIKAATPIKTNFSRREVGMMRPEPSLPRTAAGGNLGADREKFGQGSSKRDAGIAEHSSAGKESSYSRNEVGRNQLDQHTEKKLGPQTSVQAVPAPSQPHGRTHQHKPSTHSFNFDVDAPSRAHDRSDDRAARPSCEPGPDGAPNTASTKAGSWLRTLGRR